MYDVTLAITSPSPPSPSPSPSLIQDGIDFRISERGGVISSRLVANREVKSMYVFHVMARGVVTSLHYTTCRVVVAVTDLNDNPPVFLFPVAGNDTAAISPDTPLGHVIARVKVIDPDVNSTTRLSLLSGVSDAEFSIHPLTGAIRTTTTFSSLEYARKLVEVLAEDMDDPSLTSRATLYVVVDSKVLYPPSGRNTRTTVVPQRNLVILVSICVSFGVICSALVIAIFVLRARKKRLTAGGASGTGSSGGGGGMEDSLAKQYDPYTLGGYTNATLSYEKGAYDDDEPPPFYNTMVSDVIKCCVIARYSIKDIRYMNA